MVGSLVAPRMLLSVDRLDELDHKTQLQELCARTGIVAPVYELSSTGPDHAKVFTARVVVGDRILGEGEGRTKKSAEQFAAAQACAELA